MKIKRVAIVLSIIFLSRLVVSCCKCPDPKEMKYHYGEMTLSNLDNTEEYAFITDADEVSKNAFGIQIKLIIENGEKYYTPRNLGFANANAMYCDCIYEEFKPSASIVSISVITHNDFDSDITSGSDVTSHFAVDTSYDYISISDYVNSEKDVHSNWLPESNIIRMLLLKPPFLDGEFSFKVIIEFSNGDIVSSQSKPINLI